MTNINGCGPWWLPQWMKNSYYENECNRHDRFYTNVSLSRFDADRKFLKKMVKVADSDFRILQAIVYYLAVRALGWTSYGSQK